MRNLSPSRTDLSVGSFYDPRLLSDFGGRLFQLTHAKLLQRNLVDANGDIIAPWQTYDKLQPGTLVMMKVQLLTFEISNQRADGFKKVRQFFARNPISKPEVDQIYQFLIERLRDLAHLGEEIEARAFVTSAPNVSHGDPINAKRDEMDDAFDSFSLAKKPKLITEPHQPAATSTTSAAASARPVIAGPVRLPHLTGPPH
jgi:hypothetical protein